MTVSTVEVRQLRKRYGAREVLAGVDFEVGTGEVFALLGPNGAGKTTTVDILEGHRDATSGVVRVLGLDPATRPRALRARVGVVLQECGFPNHLRVGELVEAWRAYYSRPRPRDELLEVVELRGEQRQLVRHLSGGQRRRLDFALALAGDPDLIFLDEPTTGFDPEARRRCWSAIENLRNLGKTIFLTTHYLEEAERLADRVGILTDGVIRALGPPSELARAARLPTTISFAVPSHAAERKVRAFRPFEASVQAGRASVRTVDPSACLQLLLAELGELDGLGVRPPTLEDVYLQLVELEEVS